jgi:hypothetical protein
MDAFLTKPARLNGLRPIIKERLPQTWFLQHANFEI